MRIPDSAKFFLTVMFDVLITGLFFLMLLSIKVQYIPYCNENMTGLIFNYSSISNLSATNSIYHIPINTFSEADRYLNSGNTMISDVNEEAPASFDFYAGQGYNKTK